MEVQHKKKTSLRGLPHGGATVTPACGIRNRGARESRIHLPQRVPPARNQGNARRIGSDHSYRFHGGSLTLKRSNGFRLSETLGSPGRTAPETLGGSATAQPPLAESLCVHPGAFSTHALGKAPLSIPYPCLLHSFSPAAQARRPHVFHRLASPYAGGETRPKPAVFPQRPLPNSIALYVSNAMCHLLFRGHPPFARHCGAPIARGIRCSPLIWHVPGVPCDSLVFSTKGRGSVHRVSHEVFHGFCTR